MKKCAICNSEYDSRIEYCFRDGSLLSQGSVQSTRKMVTSQLSSMEDPIDMMQTLDNISIDDILQIGGQGGFQGFGDFKPIEAPASKDGDTLSMSRSSLKEMLEVEQSASDSELSSSGSSSDSPNAVGANVPDVNQDVEDVLGSFGNEIGAHLDDTLDGVQVGQLMEDSGFSMDDTNEILPGDTLDLMVDDLDVPEMSEGELGRFNQQHSDVDLDKWEASGPIMQDAARQALEEHRKRSGQKEDSALASGGASPVVDMPKSTTNSKAPILIGVAVLLVGGAVWLFSGNGSDSEVVNTAPSSKRTKREIVVPTVKQGANPDGNPDPDFDKDASVTDDKKEKAATDVTDGKDPSSDDKSTKPTPPEDRTDRTDRTNRTNVSKPVNTSSPANKDTTSAVSKEPTQPKKPTVKPPPKPKTTPKPMPKKDPAEDNGWQVQSGGWGDVTCGVTVRSNVSSAEVFIDGVRKGKVGSGISVDCGEYTLEVRSEGYETRKRQINLTTDATFTMDLVK